MGKTTSEAAAILGVSVGFISRLCRNGKLKAIMHGRDWDIDPDSVEQYRTAPKGKGGRPAGSRNKPR